ncbi:MAG: helix-turn-helix domain-containing protein [Sarcina sp.]
MIKNRLKNLREYFNLSQQELADKLLLSKASISLFENDKRELSPRTIKSIIDIYGVNKDWLLGLSAEMFSEESKNLILLTEILEKLNSDDPLILSIINKILSLDFDEIETLLPIIDKYLEKKER